MKFTYLATALLCCQSLLAQFPVSKFGSVDRSELELESCPFDKEAVAMKIFDITETELEVFETVRLTTERHVRIKILSEVGFPYASIKIPYTGHKRFTKIRDFSAIIYNMDAQGKIVTEKLDKTDVFKEQIIDNLRTITFTFPNVKKGSVIEYRYTKIEKNETRLDPWILQESIPTMYAGASITIPHEGVFFSKTFGFDTVNYRQETLFPSSNYPKIRRIYQKKNIPAFKPEAFMSSAKDNQLKIVFEVKPLRFTITEPTYAWKAIGDALLQSEFFGKLIRDEIAGTGPVVDSARKISNQTERIAFLFESVKNHFKDISGQSFLADDLSSAWTERVGTTADINLTLLNLFRKTGLKSYPILVSTRQNGMVAMDFPSLGQIDGVDIMVYDSLKGYILDASQNHSFKIPPSNILNRNVYLLDPSDMKWFYLEDSRILSTIHSRVVGAFENGMVKGEITIRKYDYAREEYKDSLQAGEEKTSVLYASRLVGFKILSDETENGKRYEDPSVQKIKFDFEPNNDGTFFYLNPQFIFQGEKNPFLAQQRQTDIDFGSRQKIFVELTLKVDKGYNIEHLPANIRLRSSDTTMSFNRLIFHENGVVVYRQELDIRRPFFYKEEYQTVYEFFEKMYTYLKEEIVLKKN